MRLLICGDRNWKDIKSIYKNLERLHKEIGVEVVIEGEARGADRLGSLCAFMLKIPVLRFPANWNKYGKAAGPIRNQQMLTEGNPDYYLAFHSNIENSSGTKDMVRRLDKALIPGELICS